MKRIAIWALALAAACGGSPRAPKHPDPTETPATPAVTATSADPYASLGLDFEDLDGDHPRGWNTGVDGKGTQSYGERVVVTDIVHGGGHAIRFHLDKSTGFVSSNTSFDAAAVRGKHLRLYGWVRTQDVVDGWAGLWIRVDGGAEMAFDNMEDRGVTGSGDWREVYAEVDVPADGKTVVIGPLLVGAGTAWFDDLRLEATEIVPPHPIAIDGTVYDAAGAPVADADVAMIALPAGEIATHVRSGADGTFHFDAISGRIGFSAVKQGLAGGFVDGVDYQEDGKVSLGLGGGDAVTVKGKLVGGAIPEGAYLRVSPFSKHDSDVFAVAVAADGSFEALLPRGDKYWIQGLDKISVAVTGDRNGDTVTVDAEVAVLAPAPEEVSTWIAAHAVPLATTEAGHGFDDMKAIGKMVGKAHVVGLGEATHGTREFFQLKHRFLEYLVAEKGFTVFAIEANQPECRAINDYVLHGTGDARTVIAGMYFWTWDTEEVLAMVEWMRTWNADPKHKKKVQFVGIDMQFTMVAEKNVAAYLAKVAPDDAEALIAPIAALGDDDAYAKMTKATPEVRAAVDAGLAKLATLAKTWKDADAAHDVTVMQQAMKMYAVSGESDMGFEVRDESMAANLRWIRAQQPKGTKIVVWAHNGHVGYELFSYKNLGQHLHAAFKKDYVVFGFAFGQGSFQAITNGKLQENTLGAAPEWDLSAPFTRAGKPLLVLDLRTIPKKGVVHDWFGALHPMRDTGAVFTSEEAMSAPVAITRTFDALIYVAETTRARPLPAMEKAPKE